MTMHWRMRLIQIACVLVLAVAVPPPEVALAAGPIAPATIVLECDEGECEQQCDLNRETCEEQGTITGDCTGECLGEGNENDCDGDECDYCLSCLIDP